LALVVRFKNTLGEIVATPPTNLDSARTWGDYGRSDDVRIGQQPNARLAESGPLTPYIGDRGSDRFNWSKAYPVESASGGNGLSWVIGGSKRSTITGDAESAGTNSFEGTAPGSGRMTRPPAAKAREALWAAICFNMSVAA
jgi:hypothetical protein